MGAWCIDGRMEGKIDAKKEGGGNGDGWMSDRYVHKESKLVREKEGYKI